MAGTPCPYMGKIGKDATEQWKENQDERPDTEKNWFRSLFGGKEETKAIKTTDQVAAEPVG